MRNTAHNLLGYLFILSAATLWALLGPVSRLVLANGLAPLEVAFWRAAFGGLCFLLHAAAVRELKVNSARDARAFLLFGICSVGGLFVCYQYAVRLGGAALASVLLYTAPAWVALFSRCLLGERMRPATLLAVFVSLTGAACIGFSGPGLAVSEPGPDGELAFWGGPALGGVFFGLLSGLLYATHYIFSATYLKKYTAFTIYAWCMSAGALAILPLVPFAPKNGADWLCLAALGVISTYAAFWAYCEGVKRLPPTKAAVLATFEPLLATLLAWLVWGEMFAPLGWLGSGLIIGAVFIMVMQDRKNQDQLKKR